MVRKNRLGWLAAPGLTIVGLAPGCATTLLRNVEKCTITDSSGYLGTMLDLCSLETFLAPIGIVDLPFSLLADTFFVTLAGVATGLESLAEARHAIPRADETEPSSSEHRECPHPAAEGQVAVPSEAH